MINVQSTIHISVNCMHINLMYVIHRYYSPLRRRPFVKQEVGGTQKVSGEDCSAHSQAPLLKGNNFLETPERGKI